MDVRLPDGERALALKLAEAALPPGERLPGGSAATVERYERVMQHGHPSGVLLYRALLRALDLAALATGGRRFASLDRDAAEGTLERLRTGALPQRLLVGALVTPLKAAHFEDPEIYRTLGCTWDFRTAAVEPPRHAARVTRATELSAGETIECDVVVVGTGAGGAVVARELAEQGLAVALLEEGEQHSRSAATRRSRRATASTSSTTRDCSFWAPRRRSISAPTCSPSSAAGSCGSWTPTTASPPSA